MKQSFKSSLLHTLAAAILVGMPMHQVQSAPGTLPTSPLYLSTIVEPNVFMTLDDSFSMIGEYTIPLDTGGLGAGVDIIVDDGTLVDVGRVWVNGSFRLSLHPAVLNTQVIPPASGPAGSVVLPEAWVFRNHDANKNYYNPSIDYVPWPGIDGSGKDLYCDIRVSPSLACETAITAVPFYTRTWSPIIN